MDFRVYPSPIGDRIATIFIVSGQQPSIAETGIQLTHHKTKIVSFILPLVSFFVLNVKSGCGRREENLI